MTELSREEIAFQTERCLKLSREGLSYNAIAKVMGISASSVMRRIHGPDYVPEPRPVKVTPALPVKEEKWTEERSRHARAKFKKKVGLEFIAEDSNKQYPHLAPLTGSDVRAELYGERF